MLSLFCILLMVAAGSKASPCKPYTNSSSSYSVSVGSGSYTPKTNEKIAAQQPVDQTNTNAASPSSLSLSLPTSDATAAPPSSTSSASQSSGGSSNAGNGLSSTNYGPCRPGFINTVFNTDAPQQNGWPQVVWNSLTSYGVNEWIGFSLQTLDQKPDYNVTDAQKSQMGQLNKAQIHVVMDPNDTTAAVSLLSSDNPPPFLELFNEPDYSFEGVTPLTDPVTAAKNLQQLFSIPHPNTTYISPALMDANGPWLPQFNQSCNNCFDQIPIIALHAYDPDPNGVMQQITQLHNTWADKRIWITELSPANSECTLDADGIANYINTLFPQILATGYVDKVFWNSGEWDPTPINNASTACSPSLTDVNGNATPVLQALGKFCGVNGDAATS